MMTEYARRSARVLLLDSADRILLVSTLPPAEKPELGPAWITPGGGVEPDEDLPTAAVRELVEEIGLRIDPTGLSHVAHAAGPIAFWRPGVFRDDFFVYRVDRHEVDTAGHTELERKTVTGYRWWTLAELAETEETVYPWGLHDLLTQVVAGRIPETPVELPWHH